MKTIHLLALTAAALAPLAAAPALGQTRAEQDRWEQAQRRFDNERAIYEREREIYENAVARDRDRRGRYDRGDPYETDYDAARYYRDDPRYQERRLGADDYVYRGSDGRYYCRRSDGTTGLIIGGAAGGILGNVIDGGRHRTGGTLIGGALGALLGRSIEQNQADIRCR
jgi:Ni/Co efflux regulator RcnB